MKTKIIPKELIKAIIFQLKKKGAFKNIFITNNAFGILNLASHQNTHCNEGKPKIMYPTIESATKAAEKMSFKHDCHFSIYKCAFCEGYHIGRNKENRKER